MSKIFKKNLLIYQILISTQIPKPYDTYIPDLSKSSILWIAVEGLLVLFYSADFQLIAHSFWGSVVPS